MKKTKIVCTIGPASTDLEILKEMIKQGMNVTRLNFSHGNYAEHLERIQLIKKAREEMKQPIAIMLDTKGPEIRTGLLVDNQPVELVQGQEFVLTTDDIVGDHEKVAISYKNLPHELVQGDTVLIDDGLIELKVNRKDDKNIYTTVINEGMLGEHKSINIPNVAINLPGLTPKDIEDIKFGIQQNVDFIAASFVRRPQDVIDIRHILDMNGGSGIQIISKIESQEGISNFKEILELSDGIMVARGDLGVEIPAQDVPIIQKKLIHRCNVVGKPVITATQMLDSMIRNPRPTRAEVADVANAVFDGTDAVMLSGETANGEYPVITVKTMSEIVQVAEVADEFKANQSFQIREKGISNAICEAAVSISANLNIKSIIASTSSGASARGLSKYKPDAIIYATSFRYQTIRQLCLSWGVYGIHIPQASNSELLIRESLNAIKKRHYVRSGQRVICVAGVPVGASGTTNMLRILTIGHSKLKGKPGGKVTKVTGIAKKVRVPSEYALENFNPGDILIVPRLTSDILFFAPDAGAIITEEKGEISEYLLRDLKNTPYIVDVDDVFERIREGAIITVDTENGVIEQTN